MKRTCKCHGISGSCSIQTCWLQLANFRELGNYLKAKYEQALKIEMDKQQLRAGNSAEGHWIPTEAFLPSAEAELIFLEDSPDYCTRNSSLGIYGTEGRECLQNSRNTSRWEQCSCGRLCTECGLQVEERRTEAISSCHCKFQWCCAVKCDQCRHVVSKYYCTRSPRSARSRGKGSAWQHPQELTAQLYDSGGGTASLLERRGKENNWKTIGLICCPLDICCTWDSGGPRWYNMFLTELKWESGPPNLGRPHFIFSASYFLVFLPMIL